MAKEKIMKLTIFSIIRISVMLAATIIVSAGFLMSPVEALVSLILPDRHQVVDEFGGGFN